MHEGAALRGAGRCRTRSMAFTVHSSCDIPQMVWTMLRGEIWVTLGYFAACCMVVALAVTGWALGLCLGLPFVSGLENGPFPPYFGLAPSLIVGACHVCLWEEGAGRSGCLSSPQGKWGETLQDPSASPGAFAWPCDSCQRDLGTDALGIRLTREGCLQKWDQFPREVSEDS